MSLPACAQEVAQRECVYHATDTWEHVVKRHMGRRIGGGLPFALHLFPGCQGYNHHILRRHAVIFHATGLDDHETIIPVNPRGISPGKGRKAIFIIRLSAKGIDGVMKPEGCAFAVENCLLYCPRRCSANYTDRGGEWRGCIAATPHVYMVRPPVKASTNGASK